MDLEQLARRERQRKAILRGMSMLCRGSMHGMCASCKTCYCHWSANARNGASGARAAMVALTGNETPIGLLDQRATRGIS